MKYEPTLNNFIPWQPSTWPGITAYNLEFSLTLNRIIKETMLDEISNVISDANKVNGGLTHRGHVIILAMLCAVDSIASYAFTGSVGNRYGNFIKYYFPSNYKPFAEDIYKLYRNSSVHSWNLFEVAITPGDEPININGNSLSFGLINFFDALIIAVNNYLADLKSNKILQNISLNRYSKLKNSAI